MPSANVPPTPARLSRRAALASGVAVTLACALAPRRLLAAPPGPRQIVLHNTHTQESLTSEYWRDGQYSPASMASIEQLLRDHRNGAVHWIDPNLLDLLCAAAERSGRDAEFEVISGYRSPASNAAMHARSAGVAAHSLHMQGRAIDVRLVGCESARLRDAGLALGRGGVGFYAGLQFVHLDTGRVRSWAG